MFVYELSGSGFESSCSHLNFRFCACFEQGVPWHLGNYRVWIHSETSTWHDKNIQFSSFVSRFFIFSWVFAFVMSFFILLWFFPFTVSFQFNFDSSTLCCCDFFSVAVIFQFYFVARFCFYCEFSILFCSNFFILLLLWQLCSTVVARFMWKRIFESKHRNLEHVVLPSTLLINKKEVLYRIQENEKRAEIYWRWWFKTRAK